MLCVLFVPRELRVDIVSGLFDKNFLTDDGALYGPPHLLGCGGVLTWGECTNRNALSLALALRVHVVLSALPLQCKLRFPAAAQINFPIEFLNDAVGRVVDTCRKEQLSIALQQRQFLCRPFPARQRLESMLVLLLLLLRYCCCDWSAT